MAVTRKQTPYHHRDLREALIRAGRKLLEEKGLRGFTLRECARRAEVSHAALRTISISINDLLAEIATRASASSPPPCRRARDGRRATFRPAWSARVSGYMALPPPIPCRSASCSTANRRLRDAGAGRGRRPRVAFCGDRDGHSARAGRGEGAHVGLRLGHRARLHHAGAGEPDRRGAADAQGTESAILAAMAERRHRPRPLVLYGWRTHLSTLANT